MDVVGVLTGGGDCPGLNAVVRGVVARATARHGVEVVGILDGWDGLMDGRVRPLDRSAVRGILQRGGTILGTSRRDPYVHGDGYESVHGTLTANGIEALVVIGGDGTLRSAQRLHEEGLPVVAVPKTIDNDIAGTDMTFGFDTAVQVATEAIDRLTTTAEAHNRINAAGSSAKISLTSPEGSPVTVDLSFERLRELDLQPGETVFVTARHARVFVPDYEI